MLEILQNYLDAIRWPFIDIDRKSTKSGFGNISIIPITGRGEIRFKLEWVSVTVAVAVDDAAIFFQQPFNMISFRQFKFTISVIFLSSYSTIKSYEYWNFT
jgi:hypothetical protein